MDLTTARDHLAGVVAITVTPFDENNEIDEPAFERVLRRAVDGGVTTFTVNGNTSEFYTLTPGEARRGLELTLRSVPSGTMILAGVGFDVRTAVESARAARSAGASGIMIHQPVHPYVSPEGWVDYHVQIASAVPELAVVPYVKLPGLGGAQFKALTDACPNVVGVKYAVPDVVRFTAVSRDAALEHLVWIAGLAEMYAPAYYAVGASGFTSGLVNIDPAQSLRMARALRGGDFPGALRVWDAVREFEELRADRGSADNVSVIKEALAQLGDCSPAVRPPSTPVNTQVKARISKVMAEWGVS